jgi:hypothetical protein
MTGISRIALIAVLSLLATLQLPRACDRVASNGGVLYLRAQYKLAKGEPDAARRLMQRAVEAEHHSLPPAPAGDSASPCATVMYAAPFAAL